MLTEPLCKDRRCIVVGSAPGALQELEDACQSELCSWLTLAANGGAGVAREAGLIVSVLLTTSYLFRPRTTRQEVATIDAMRGTRCSSIWIDEGHYCDIVPALAAVGVTYDQITRVDPSERHLVTTRATGSPLRVSTGVWAACLAYVSGAASVRVVGVRPESHGHHGMPWDAARRDHVRADTVALQAMRVAV
jgi:hypothetical protein